MEKKWKALGKACGISLPLCTDAVFDAAYACSSEGELFHQTLEELLVDGFNCREGIACELYGGGKKS
jgi:hypothetical protein